MQTTPNIFSRYRTPISLLLTVCIITIILVATRKAPLVADSSEQARRVEYTQVKLGSRSPTIPVYVKVSTPELATLRSAIPADVSKLVQLAGTIVNAGDDIVILDDREARLSVKQRQADVKEIEATIADQINKHENELFVLGDVKKLDANGKRNRNNIIKDHKIQLTRLNAQLERAKAALALAELDLSRTKIRSPFNGRVTQLHVSVGDRVRQGDMIATVYNLEAIELQGPVASRYTPGIQSALDKGHALNGTYTIGGQSFQAKAVRLSGIVDESTATTTLYLSPSVLDTYLPLGKVLELDLQLPAVANSFVLPVTSLYGTDTIYRISDNRLEKLKVARLGDYTDDEGTRRVLVSSADINEGDQVLTTQLPNAIDRLLVEPVNTSDSIP